MRLPESFRDGQATVTPTPITPLVLLYSSLRSFFFSSFQQFCHMKRLFLRRTNFFSIITNVSRGHLVSPLHSRVTCCHLCFHKSPGATFFAFLPRPISEAEPSTRASFYITQVHAFASSKLNRTPHVQTLTSKPVKLIRAVLVQVLFPDFLLVLFKKNRKNRKGSNYFQDFEI